MNILITGAAGFLGSHLVEHFLKEGHSVIGIDNMSGGSYDNLKFISHNLDENDYGFDFESKNPKFEFKEADCRDFHFMSACMKNVDVVYHCAALAHEGLSVFSPSLITKSIYESSVSVFSAAIAAGVKRIIFMSSMARYGKGVRGEFPTEFDTYPLDPLGPPFGEDTHYPKPEDPYGIAKVAAEETLKCLAEVHGVEYVITVPHNIIGVRQNYTDPHRNVVSIMMNRLKQGKDVIIYGDGTQTRCFSPVADNIRCLAGLANLSDKRPVGQVINIGPDRGTITVLELAEKLYGLAGKVPSPIFVGGRPQEVKHATCSSNKARELLGYVEQQELDACLQEMWEQIPTGGKPFIYDDKPLEIVNEKTPETWTKKLI